MPIKAGLPNCFSLALYFHKEKVKHLVLFKLEIKGH